MDTIFYEIESVINFIGRYQNMSVHSILAKASLFKSVCNKYSNHTLHPIISLIHEIFSLSLVIANKGGDGIRWIEECEIVVGNVMEMFPAFHASAISANRKQLIDGILPISFEVVYSELEDYKNMICTFIGRDDLEQLNQFKNTMTHHQTAPKRWCFLGDKKCIPVLFVRDGILVEDWLPE